MNQEKINEQVFARLSKLERAVFSQQKKVPKTKINNAVDYMGPKGGTLFLIQRGYLNNRRTPKEVMAELEKNNYNYQLQVVRNTLNRLSSTRGPLTRLTVDGQYVYVKRK